MSVSVAILAQARCFCGTAPQERLALVCRRGLLFPLVMFFGAKQGPGAFQQLMDTTFGDLRDENNESFHSVFIDDCSVFTDAWDDESDDDKIRDAAAVAARCRRSCSEEVALVEPQPSADAARDIRSSSRAR